MKRNLLENSETIETTEPPKKRLKPNEDFDDGEVKVKFELQTTQLSLTYSQCPIEPQAALDMLMDKLHISEYIVAQEEHKDGGMHLHCYLKLSKKCRIRNPNALDLGDYHGKYESTRSSARWQKYCKKDGNFITNMDFKIPKDVIDKARSGDIKGAFDMVAEHMPMEVVRFGRNITDNLATLTLQVANKAYDRKAFYEPLQVQIWEQKYKHKRSLILHGRSGIGKTEYAKSLLEKPLLVSHKDQLKALKTGDYDGIIFDDMSFTHWPRDPVIHLIDPKNIGGVDIKFGHVDIPKGMPRIFTCNVPIFNEDPENAYDRRLYYVKIDTDLRKEDDENVLSDWSGTGDVPPSFYVKKPDWKSVPSNVIKGPPVGDTEWTKYVPLTQQETIDQFLFDDEDLKRNKIHIENDNDDDL